MTERFAELRSVVHTRLPDPVKMAELIVNAPEVEQEWLMEYALEQLLRRGLDRVAESLSDLVVGKPDVPLYKHVVGARVTHLGRAGVVVAHVPPVPKSRWHAGTVEYRERQAELIRQGRRYYRIDLEDGTRLEMAHERHVKEAP